MPRSKAHPLKRFLSGTTIILGLILCAGCFGGGGGGGGSTGDPPADPPADPPSDPSFSLEWNKRYGADEAVGVFGVAPAADGGFVTFAHTAAGISNDKTEASRGEDDYWLVKVDANGTKVWDKTYGGDGNDYARAMTATADGGFLVAGISYSGISGDRTQASYGEWDVWVLKLAADGSKEWDRRYGGTSRDYCEDIIPTSDGGYLIVGSTLSGVGHEVSQPSQGQFDLWFFKIDAAGNYLWDQRYGGDKNDYARSVVELASGGFAIAGDSNSSASGDLSQPLVGRRDYWLLKVDSAGALLWEERFGGNRDDLAEAVAETDDGGLFIGGRTSSGLYGNKTMASFGSTDYWLVRTTSDGSFLWDMAFGGDGGDALTDLTPGASNTMLVSGYSLSGITGNRTETSRGDGDYWTIRIDSDDGTIHWDKRYGGNNSDEAHGLLALGDGSYVVAGKSASPAGGDKSEGVHNYSYDMWIIRFDDGPWNPATSSKVQPLPRSAN